MTPKDFRGQAKPGIAHDDLQYGVFVMKGILVPSAAEPAKLRDVKAVADVLDCSTQHVYRLSDAGRMPRPLRLGSLVRWSRFEIEEWIASVAPLAGKGGNDE